jgi:hypothetical protein
VPRGEHEDGEGGVGGDKQPGRCAVVEQLLQPVLDECTAIRRLASAGTQRHLQRRERASKTQPGLADDDRDRRQVSRPEPEVVHPMPMREVAYDGKHQPAHNERSNAGVDDQHAVREQQAERRVEQHRAESRVSPKDIRSIWRGQAMPAAGCAYALGSCSSMNQPGADSGAKPNLAYRSWASRVASMNLRRP